MEDFATSSMLEIPDDVIANTQVLRKHLEALQDTPVEDTDHHINSTSTNPKNVELAKRSAEMTQAFFDLFKNNIQFIYDNELPKDALEDTLELVTHLQNYNAYNAYGLNGLSKNYDNQETIYSIKIIAEKYLCFN